MEYIETDFEGLYVIQPRIFSDARGYFFESYSKQKELDAGLDYNWVQDNEAFSSKGVLRGLHFQIGASAQAKLVRVILGEVQDVVVDIRPESKTYGQYYSILLSAENKKQLLIPKGFAHSYLVTSDEAIFSYKCDNFYDKNAEGGIIYYDKFLDIDWKLSEEEFIVSEKDKILPDFGAHKAIEI